MTRVLTILTSVMIALFMSTTASAAPPRAAAASSQVKIGVVDMQRIIKDSKAAKAAREAFEKELEARRVQIEAKEKEVRNLEAEISRLDPSTSLEVRRQKADKLKQETRELNNLRQDTEEELKRKDVEMTQKIIGDIMTVVRNFARSERFTAIFERSVIMAADEAVDITDRILKIYDQKK
ncbi:MAG: OmpH family outer membrane protein [Syntrophales bacterium]|nr:OmpH family outer membrane protein [Syntrophales bacterium]